MIWPFFEFALLQDHEHDPWPQAVAAGHFRRITPGQPLVVELEVRHIVGFEIGDPMAGLSLDYCLLIDADDIAWAIEFHVSQDGFGQRAAIQAFPFKPQIDRDGGS